MSTGRRSEVAFLLCNRRLVLNARLDVWLRLLPHSGLGSRVQSHNTWCSAVILLNSSTQQMPLSARTRAPASRAKPPVSGSLTTDAVKPAVLDVGPHRYKPLGAAAAAAYRIHAVATSEKASTAVDLACCYCLQLDFHGKSDDVNDEAKDVTTICSSRMTHASTLTSRQVGQCCALRSWLLPMPGSPTIRQWMSPRMGN